MRRRSDRFLAALALLWGAVAALALEARVARPAAEAERARTAALVRALGLTDLALFTEARYTRHPSQADRFAAFQDHPHALEHFPSGSVVPPP